MSDDTTLRLERLETLLAMQDRTIEELNTALFEQQRQMDLLEQQVKTLAAKLRTVLASQEQMDIQDVPPPHYNG